MRRIWRKAKPREIQKKFRVNEEIRAREVFLIDENGQALGVMPLPLALDKAREAELDLVEVGPKPEPPIAKIIDFGQFKYERDKKAHKQKVQQKKVEIKGVRLSLRISPHDFNLRLEQAKKFLTKGQKVKIELILKGRERQHAEKGKEIINNFIKELSQDPQLNVVKEDLTMERGRFNVIISGK